MLIEVIKSGEVVFSRIATTRESMFLMWECAIHIHEDMEADVIVGTTRATGCRLMCNALINKVTKYRG